MNEVQINTCFASPIPNVALLLKVSILFHGSGKRRLYFNLILLGLKRDIYIDILYILAFKRKKSVGLILFAYIQCC